MLLPPPYERETPAPAICKEFAAQGGAEAVCHGAVTAESSSAERLAAGACAQRPAGSTTTTTGGKTRVRAVRRLLPPLRLLSRLPAELQLQVLSHTPPAAVLLLKHAQSPLHGLVAELTSAHETHLFHLTLAHQFAAEAAVFPRTDPSHTRSLWTSPDGIPWALYSRGEYLATLHRIQTLTGQAVAAVQAAMPLMAQREMVYWALLYCWKLLRYAPGDPQRGVWRWFGALDKRTQAEIDNFFNNMAGAFLAAWPLQWPRECGCMHVRDRQSWERCRYRVPERLAEEMEGSGVSDLVAKQMLLVSVGRLLGFLWNHGRELSGEDEERARSWFLRETWAGAAVLSHRCAHMPFAPLVLALRDETYEVWVYGRGGMGSVELRCRHWRDDVCRMLETAVSLPAGEWLELGWFEQEQEHDVPSFVVDRGSWWSWWWWESLGLERLFALPAASE